MLSKQAKHKEQKVYGHIFQPSSLWQQVKEMRMNQPREYLPFYVHTPRVAQHQAKNALFSGHQGPYFLIWGQEDAICPDVRWVWHVQMADVKVKLEGTGWVDW